MKKNATVSSKKYLKLLFFEIITDRSEFVILDVGLFGLSFFV